MSNLPPDEIEKNATTLNAQDAAVVDALLDARARGAATGPMPTGSAERSEVARRLLALLDLDAPQMSDEDHDSGAETLIAATLACVASARLAESQPAVEVTTLSDADGAVLDAVLANGGAIPGAASGVIPRAGAGPMPAGSADRAERVRGVLGLLDQLPVEIDQASATEPHGGDALVQRTLDAAAELRQRERFAQQIEMFAEPRRTLGVGWRQLATSAAVLLIGMSLLMPAISHNQQVAQQTACRTNLAVAGQQMGAFAMDHQNTLPRGPVGSSWINVGQPDAVDAQGRYQSNSAHLFLLIRQGYAAPERLACASNQHAALAMPGSGQLVDWQSPQAVSYSYQNQNGQPIRIDQSSPQLAVLADKSPLFIVDQETKSRLVFNRSAARDASSTLHRGKGQNILTLDGGVRWQVQPMLGEDNIWQIQGHTGDYVGNEAPADAQRDSFLVP